MGNGESLGMHGYLRLSLFHNCREVGTQLSLRLVGLARAAVLPFQAAGVASADDVDWHTFVETRTARVDKMLSDALQLSPKRRRTGGYRSATGCSSSAAPGTFRQFDLVRAAIVELEEWICNFNAKLAV